MSRLLLRAAFLGLVVGWFVVLRPVVLGGPASYILVGGESMEPTIRAGSLVVAFEAADYRVGDVVVYRVPAGEPASGRQVIHRIVGGSSTAGFVLQGDNAGATDIWHPTGADVLGRASVAVPSIADAIVVMRSPVVVAAFAAAIAAFSCLSIFAGSGWSRDPLSGPTDLAGRATDP
jgi:signal peptidase I